LDFAQYQIKDSTSWAYKQNPLNPSNKRVFSVSKQVSLGLAKIKVFVPMSTIDTTISGSLSPWQCMSSTCGWRNGIEYGG